MSTLLFSDKIHRPFVSEAGEESLAKMDKLRHAKGSSPTADIRLKLQKAMQKDAAVFRTEKTLQHGLCID